MKLPIFLNCLLAALLALGLSACGPAPRQIAQTPVAAGPTFGSPPISPQWSLYEWNDDGGQGEVSVRINLSNQMATFHRGGREIGWSYVTTGRPGHSTPSGSFRITEKTVDKYSNRWGQIVDSSGNVVNTSARNTDRRGPGERWVAAAMPYWMRLTSQGVGIHAGPIPRPGTAVSAGCIRLPSELAPRVFNAVRVGTPVTIVR
jgi:lipoprotein-anchoring transpeptidase ErfK/SrfK